MYKNFNLTQTDVSISNSMISFKEYYMSFIGTKDLYLENGWGWFVDIELNYESSKIIGKSYWYNVSIPETIREYPSIRSMKSMTNLHENSMIVEMDDKLTHRTNNCDYFSVASNTIGLIGVALCCFMIL